MCSRSMEPIEHCRYQKCRGVSIRGPLERLGLVGLSSLRAELQRSGRMASGASLVIHKLDNPPVVVETWLEHLRFGKMLFEEIPRIVNSCQCNKGGTVIIIIHLNHFATAQGLGKIMPSRLHTSTWKNCPYLGWFGYPCKNPCTGIIIF